MQIKYLGQRNAHMCKLKAPMHNICHVHMHLIWHCVHAHVYMTLSWAFTYIHPLLTGIICIATHICVTYAHTCEHAYPPPRLVVVKPSGQFQISLEWSDGFKSVLNIHTDICSMALRTWMYMALYLYCSPQSMMKMWLFRVGKQQRYIIVSTCQDSPSIVEFE